MKWKFKKNAPPQGTSDNDWYCLCEGYIKPEEILRDEKQIKELKEAIKLVESFLDTIEENGLRIEF